MTPACKGADQPGGSLEGERSTVYAYGLAASPHRWLGRWYYHARTIKSLGPNPGGMAVQCKKSEIRHHYQIPRLLYLPSWVSEAAIHGTILPVSPEDAHDIDAVRCGAMTLHMPTTTHITAGYLEEPHEIHYTIPPLMDQGVSIEATNGKGGTRITTWFTSLHLEEKERQKREQQSQRE